VKERAHQVLRWGVGGRVGELLHYFAQVGATLLVHLIGIVFGEALLLDVPRQPSETNIGF
jgi:hypothetical protein